MKNKWYNLKEEWKIWMSLLYNETGLGWDLTKKTIDASDEWWESKIQVFLTSFFTFMLSSALII